ncbi:MAG TPA: hypothetical protein PKA32_02710, partial [Candidatus Gracilibacteria bacterium]|nr:hypothetical protein [Candidatus Gracilibacteria bacterium]
MNSGSVGFLEQFGRWVIENPLWFLGITATIIAFVVVGLRISNYLYIVLYASKKFVHMRVSLPREESPKDKEKSEEKDFKEKIAVMEQFFRNIHELSELSLKNILQTRFLKDDLVSFEYIAKDKVVDFYVVMHERYRDLIDKQITSYYPHADIQIVDPINIQPQGNELKCYFAYQNNPFYFPIKTYKTLENDPLNDLTNIFSKFEETDVASIQIVVRPKAAKKW